MEDKFFLVRMFAYKYHIYLIISNCPVKCLFVFLCVYVFACLYMNKKWQKETGIL